MLPLLGWSLLGACNEPVTEEVYEPNPVDRELLVEKVVVIPYSGITTDSYLQCLPTISGAEITLEDGTPSLEISYMWSNLASAEVLGEGYVLQLSSEMAGAGDEIECRVFATDRTGDASENAASVLVERSLRHLGEQPLYFHGNRPADKLGSSIATIGDINGDGDPDFALGAPSNDSSFIDAGRVYIMTAVESSIEDAQVTFNGETIKDAFGSSVDSAGDVDGDGLADVLIGAPGFDGGGLNSGKAYLFFGANLWGGGEIPLESADFEFVGSDPYEEVGLAAAGAGDMDGDGFGDVVIGAPSNRDRGYHAGKVSLYLGDSLFDGAEVADYVFLGEESYARLGSSFLHAGDVDGDGLADLWISAPASTSRTGKLYLITGSMLLSSSVDVIDSPCILSAESAGDGMGLSFDVGDLDGDGSPDIAIGSPYSESADYMAGKVDIVYSPALTGEVSLESANATFLGEYADDRAGTGLAVLSDVDGDERAELLIGAPGSNQADTSAGKVYIVYSGIFTDGGEYELGSIEDSFLGEAANDGAGTAIERLGDIDGDSLDDFLLSAPQSNGGGSDSGTVYVIMGSTL
jgi:hypothetical protein